MDLNEAADNFGRATLHCDNLITVHRGYGGTGRGRRAEEISVNRAVVVIAVASWQAVIQDYTLACLDLSVPQAGSPLTATAYSVITGPVRNAVGDFSTPNGQNTRRLMQSAGFDPWPTWTWLQHGGRGRGMETWTPSDADRRIGDWLKVRHAIAHGEPTMPQVHGLEAVSEQPNNPPSDPTLRLTDAERCLVFFRRLAKLTGAGLAAHLGFRPPCSEVPLRVADAHESSEALRPIPHETGRAEAGFSEEATFSANCWRCSRISRSCSRSCKRFRT